VIVRARSSGGSQGSCADLRHIGVLAAPLIPCFAATPTRLLFRQLLRQDGATAGAVWSFWRAA